MQQNAQEGRLSLQKKAIAKLIIFPMGDIYLPPTTLPASMIVSCKVLQNGQ
jgi:hypothetical protein